MRVGRGASARISARAISTLSVPMPVDTAEMRSPSHVPVTDANSRCSRRTSTVSSMPAMRSMRAGSPGNRMRSASSPGARSMWYCRSPTGSAVRRYRGGFRRGYPRWAGRPLLTLSDCCSAGCGSPAEDSPALLTSVLEARVVRAWNPRASAVRGPTGSARVRSPSGPGPRPVEPGAGGRGPDDRGQPGGHPGRHEVAVRWRRRRTVTAMDAGAQRRPSVPRPAIPASRPGNGPACRPRRGVRHPRVPHRWARPCPCRPGRRPRSRGDGDLSREHDPRRIGDHDGPAHDP